MSDRESVVHKEFHSRGTEVNSGARCTRFLLLLIVAVGGALRFYGLDLQSLWLDELLNWQMCSHGTLAEVIEAAHSIDRGPPGYHLLVFHVMQFLGDSEVALRFPSAVAGVLAIPMVYLVGEQFYSRREGLVAAVLMALSITPVHYSQEARAYALLVLLVLVSFYFWFRLLRALEAGDRPQWWVQAGYVASAIATEYLHYFGILVIVLQGMALVAIFARRPRALARVVALGVPVGVTLLLALPALVHDTTLTNPWIPDPSLDSARKAWRFFFRRPGDLYQLTALVCAVYLARAIWSARRLPHLSTRSVVTSPTFIVVLWLVLPFTFAWSKLASPILTDRYLLVSLPAAYLLLARAIVHTVPHPRAWAVVIAALAATLLYGLVVSRSYYAAVHKDQYREAAALVAQHEKQYPDAAILADGGYEYYLRRFNALDRTTTLNDRESRREQVARLLDRERPRHVWVLSGHNQAEEELLDAFTSDYRLLQHEALVGAWVHFYERVRGPGGARSPREKEESISLPVFSS